MKIEYGGLIKTTLLDYPEEISSVIFLPGCNLKCPYCHNPHIVNPIIEELIDIELIMETIYKRKNLINGVVISGGEPTLYEDIDTYIKTFQEWGLKVKLDTNGTNPERLKKLKPNYIAMDFKTSPGKYPSLGFQNWEKIVESLNWLKNSEIDYEIRTTSAPIIFTKSDLKEMIPYLKGIKRYFITNFRNGETLLPEYNLNTPYSLEEMKEFVNLCLSAGIPCTLR